MDGWGKRKRRDFILSRLIEGARPQLRAEMEALGCCSPSRLAARPSHYVFDFVLVHVTCRLSDLCAEDGRHCAHQVVSTSSNDLGFVGRITEFLGRRDILIE